MNCPQCNAPLSPNDSPGGLCAACLLKRALEPNTLVSQISNSEIPNQKSPSSQWTPPTLNQLAPFFPDLDLLSLLGRGGMGAVYKARQKSLDRIIALKILPPQLSTDPSFPQRFAHEAQALAKLNHPHIVTIYDFGQRTTPIGAASGEDAAPIFPQDSGLKTQDSLYFFLMEFIDGLSLRQLLDASPLDSNTALAIVPQICDALQYAHDRGIVHRDIKPENILLTKSGQIKIADFGLAKLIDPPSEISNLKSPTDHWPLATDPSPHAGTPQYMAPEQSSSPDAVDHRADLYALGVVFYQMLTGELPTDKFQPPSKIPGLHIDVRLDHIVLRALEKSPNLRYQNATQFKTEVQTVFTTPPSGQTSAPAPSISEISNLKSPSVSRDSIIRSFRLPSLLLRITSLINLVIILLYTLMILTSRINTLPSPNPILQLLPIAAIIFFLVANLFIIRAANNMAKLKKYSQAFAACILAVILFPAYSLFLCFLLPLFIASLIAAIWSLTLLSRTEIRAAFDSQLSNPQPLASDISNPKSTPVSTPHSLHIPSLLLRIAAVLNIILIFGGLCVFTSVAFFTHAASPSPRVFSGTLFRPMVQTQTEAVLHPPILLALIPVTLLLLCFLLLNLFIYRAARNMALYKNYGRAVTACILALLFFPTNPIGLIGAIWALIILCQSQTRTAFDSPFNPTTSNLPNAVQPSSSPPTRSSSLSIILLILFLLGLVVVVAFFLFIFTLRVTRVSSPTAEVPATIIHQRIFIASASLVDQLLPPQSRLSAEMQLSDNTTPKSAFTGSPFTASSQTRQAYDSLVEALHAASPPSPAGNNSYLFEESRPFSDWPRSADGWTYSFANPNFLGGGSGTGFIGIRQATATGLPNYTQLRVEYNIYHDVDAHAPLHIPLQARITWQGPLPPTGTDLLFLTPFTQNDGSPEYLIWVLDNGNITHTLASPSASDIQLKSAEQAYQIAYSKYKAGLITYTEFLQAQADRDLARAQRSGDPTAIAIVKFNSANEIYNSAKSQFDAGLITAEELQKFERAKNLAAAATQPTPNDSMPQSLNDSTTAPVLSPAVPNLPLPNPILPQAKPFIDAFQAVQASNAQAYRNVFIRSIREADHDWNQQLADAAIALKKSLGNTTLNQFTFTYQGDDSTGTLTVHWPTEPPSADPFEIPVTKEENEWKIAED